MGSVSTHVVWQSSQAKHQSSFVREERPRATVHDLEALKHLVYLLAVSIDGTKKLEACVETVRSYWNRFTAAWKRKYEAIPRDISESVTNVSVEPPYLEAEY